jgi:hypothetical protein
MTVFIRIIAGKRVAVTVAWDNIQGLKQGMKRDENLQEYRMVFAELDPHSL